MWETAERILKFKSLLATLTVRELKARYRGSALGFFWSLVNPLLLLGVYTFVFGFAFRPTVATTTEPFALFLVCGLFPWIWVASSLNEAVVSLSSNAGLIRKAVFPAELLPVVSVLANGAHFLLALPILAGALVVGRLLDHPVGGWAALLLPVVIALELPLLAGAALGLAALHAHFKDIKDLLSNALTLLFFLTPVLYPLEAIPFEPLRLAIAANPFSPFTLAYRALLFEGAVPGLKIWLLMVAWALAAWTLGSSLFARLRETLVEAV